MKHRTWVLLTFVYVWSWLFRLCETVCSWFSQLDWRRFYRFGLYLTPAPLHLCYVVEFFKVCYAIMCVCKGVVGFFDPRFTWHELVCVSHNVYSIVIFIVVQHVIRSVPLSTHRSCSVQIDLCPLPTNTLHLLDPLA